MSKTTPKKHIVEMSHTLNTMRNGYATKQEQRLFLVYLSRINPRNHQTLSVKISLEHFCEICEIQNTRKISQIEKLTNTILQKLVKVYNGNGGWTKYVLFNKCSLIQDNTGEWFFELSANPEALFLFIDLKKYVSFTLENALKLKSLNQMKIYCLLKDYQYQETFQIELIELIEILGLNNENFQYMYFKRDVLEVCRKEINKLTDISFEYEGIRGKGRGGKVIAIKFIISENTAVNNNENLQLKLTNNFSDIEQINCDNSTEYFPLKTNIKYDGYKFINTGEKYIYINQENEYFAEISDFIFSEQEIIDLINIIKEYTPYSYLGEDYQNTLGNVFNREYKLFVSEVSANYIKSTPVKYYYKFFRKMLENKLKIYEKECKEKLKELELQIQ